MKQKIKNFILNYLQDSENEFNPKKTRNLKAVCFESKQPLGNGKYENYLCNLTEWVNGEGYNIDINYYNEFSKNSSNKKISLNLYELEILLASLNDLGYF